MEHTETANPTPASPPIQSTEHWEQIRRSVAMLPTGSWALKREQALEALSTLIASLRAGSSAS